MSIKLKRKEQIVATARRHSVVYFWWWFLAFVFITTPFFFMFWLFNHSWWGQSIFFILLAIGLFVLARIIFVWKRNIAIITTHRVVDIDRRGFFDKFVTEIPYDNIDSVSGHVKGFFGTVCRYGLVTINSENGNIKIVLDSIKRPVYIQQKINEMKKKYNLKYSRGAVCIKCDARSGGVFKAIENKIHNFEVVELIKLKKIIEKKIVELLKESNDNM
jgi:hypothetical protein